MDGYHGNFAPQRGRCGNEVEVFEGHLKIQKREWFKSMQTKVEVL